MRWGGVVLLALIAACCVLYWEVSWQGAGPSPSTEYRTVGVGRGAFWHETAQLQPVTQPPVFGPPSHEFGVRPGLDTALTIHIIRHPVRSLKLERKQYGFSFFGTIFGVLMIVLTLPLVPPKPGECACGYDLRGFTGKVCPECGEPIVRT